MQALINKLALLDAIDYANDHPSMPDFYELKAQVFKANKILALTDEQADLLKEALNDLCNWIDTDEEYKEVESLLEALNAHVSS
ncbi:hypothetical protein IACHDJAJ_00031 [Aeromonas phage vB_AdhS_TS3]|nr:hypothetical protein IACHDJAJ_00031 [Aeromonas phage vB_AdhS_TS3]